jgi:hypothetical protein
MRDQLHSPSADGLERALAVVFEAVLRRREGGQDQAKMLRLLRSQLDEVLAEAPINGNAMEAIAFRARLAALCDAEIARLEARVS